MHFCFQVYAMPLVRVYCVQLLVTNRFFQVSHFEFVSFKLRPCGFLLVFQSTRAWHYSGFFLFLHTFQPIIIQDGSQHHQATILALVEIFAEGQTFCGHSCHEQEGNQRVWTLDIVKSRVLTNLVQKHIHTFSDCIWGGFSILIYCDLLTKSWFSN